MHAGWTATNSLTRFQIGFADRTLGLRLPEKNRKEGDALRTRLTQLGLWRDSGHEHFNGCIVVPLHDEQARSSAFTDGGRAARRRRGANCGTCIRPGRIAACSTGNAWASPKSSCAKRCSTR